MNKIYNSVVKTEKEVETKPETETTKENVPSKNPYQIEIPLVQPEKRA